jgi:hypothetical protein
MVVDDMLKGDSVTVKPEDLHSVCGQLLAEYLKEKGETVEKVIGEYADELKNLIVQSSPRRVLKDSKQYVKGWRVTKESVIGKSTFTVHNKNKPKLTHILEKGTDTRQTSKKWNRGKVEPRSHMETAFNDSMPAFIEKLKSELSK